MREGILLLLILLFAQTLSYSLFYRQFSHRTSPSIQKILQSSPNHRNNLDFHHSRSTSLFFGLQSRPIPQPDLPKSLLTKFVSSNKVQKLFSLFPLTFRSFFLSIYPTDLFLFVFFQLFYSKVLRCIHSFQSYLWKLFAFGTPYPWENSILGFIDERCRLLSKLIGGNYVFKLLCLVLNQVGFRFRSDLPVLLSNLSYTIFFVHVVDLFKAKYMKTFFPTIAENRRQNYVVNRSTSVIIWIIGGLAVCEMVSTFLKIPLSSTLAFGGVGGLAIGLSARDIAANFLGGMLLLFNEPFTPGDMVTFRAGNNEFIGRVERVGWGQTRIRGRDTRPTYIPNSHFVQTAVTNMERITHRKFETTVPIRYQDYALLPTVINKIKERLRLIPKLDVLSMPFRISFVRIASYFLEIEITVYFATKSIDEFLSLQQTANMEIIAAIKECGADLALPTSLTRIDVHELRTKERTLDASDMISDAETMIADEESPGKNVGIDAQSDSEV